MARHLALRGFSVEVHRVRGPGDARRLARATPAKARCVVSVGGDGTHREVFAGLAERSGDETAPRRPPVPVAVVPAGTENVLARTFGLTGTLREAVGLVQQGAAVPLDLGTADGRPFVMFAGVGFDAEVTRDVHRRRRGRIVRAAYYGPILRRWWTYDFAPMTVRADGRPLCDDATVVFVCNTPRYAAGLRPAPGAVAGDGLLDVVCLRIGSRWEMPWEFVRMRLGRHLDPRGVVRGRARRVEVTCEKRPLPVEADGDVVGQTPVVFRVWPRAVRLLVPAERLAARTERRAGQTGRGATLGRES